MGNLSALMPPLLRKRIEEYKIPMAPGQATFDNVLVYMLPDDKVCGEKFSKEGVIIKPQNKDSADKERCPRGVVVSAGLGAMDMLMSHGIELGDIVWFAPHVPTRFEVDRTAEGKPVYYFFFYAGDIKVSEDLPQRLVDGTMKLEFVNGHHVYNRVERTDPKVYDDSI